MVAAKYGQFIVEQSTIGADCTVSGGGGGVGVDEDSVVLDPIETIDSLPTLVPRGAIVASLIALLLELFINKAPIPLCEDESMELVPKIWLLVLLLCSAVVPKCLLPRSSET